MVKRMIVESIFRLYYYFKLYSLSGSQIGKSILFILEEAISRGFGREFFLSFIGMSQKYLELSSPLVTISFDCDLPEDIEAIPNIIEILSQRGIKACFAVVGKWVEKFPSQHEELLLAGHELINHTYSHPNNPYLNPDKHFHTLKSDERLYEIQRTHEMIEATLSYSPVGFRTPHFGNQHTKDVYTILNSLNYLYSSSTIATKTKCFGSPHLVNGVFEIPVSPAPDMPFSCLETWGIFRAPNRRYLDERDYLNQFTLVQNRFLG